MATQVVKIEKSAKAALYSKALKSLQAAKAYAEAGDIDFADNLFCKTVDCTRALQMEYCNSGNPALG